MYISFQYLKNIYTCTSEFFNEKISAKMPAATCVTYSVKNQPVCFEDEKRPRVCLPSPSLKKVFRQAEAAVAFLDSLFRKGLVSKWTIAIVIVRGTSRSASGFAPRFP